MNDTITITLTVKEAREMVKHLEEATDGGERAAHGYDFWLGRASLRDLAEAIRDELPKYENGQVARVTDRNGYVHIAEHEDGEWVYCRRNNGSAMYVVSFPIKVEPLS